MCVTYWWYFQLFGGGTLYRDLIMAAAKATYFEAHEDKMNQIKEVSPYAFDWLNVIPKKKWCKHAFPLYSNSQCYYFDAKR